MMTGPAYTPNQEHKMHTITMNICRTARKLQTYMGNVKKLGASLEQTSFIVRHVWITLNSPPQQ